MLLLVKYMPLFSIVPCIMGPTASGKTALAIQLSHLLPIELISVDSTQVYHDLDIGSGKLSEGSLKTYPHHLINIRSPVEPYSAAEFVADATQLILDIIARERLPVFVGGTMLYFKALMQGLHELPHSDPVIRQHIEEKAAHLGWPKLHEELSRVDPLTAARLSENDKQRIGRALEIYYISHQPMSWHLEQDKTASNFNFLPIALVPCQTERAVLHAHIKERFEQMLNLGLVDEVKHLREKYELHANLPSMRSVGYRQVWAYLNGSVSHQQMCEQSIAATRQLAKRQLTWLRKWPDIIQLDFMDPNNLEKIHNLIARRIEPVDA